MIVHNVKVGEQIPELAVERAHKKLYIGCAESDTRYRDMLIYGKHRWELYSKPKIDFLTLDRKAMAMIHYQPHAEKLIQAADGVMIIVSARTSKDPFTLWEIDYSRANNIPIIGVDVRQKAEGVIPAKLAGKMTKFGWEWFAAFFNSL